MLSIQGKPRFNVSKSNKSKLDNKNWLASMNRLDNKKSSYSNNCKRNKDNKS